MVFVGSLSELKHCLILYTISEWAYVNFTGYNKEPLEIKEIIVLVCRHFGLDPAELRLNTKSTRITDVRSVICYLAVRVKGHNGVEVGSQVNLRRAGVSVAAGRGEKMIINNPELITLIDK